MHTDPYDERTAQVTTVEDPSPTLAALSSRALGAYYTPSVAADHLAEWALRSTGDRVLEPSMGDGAFLHALNQASKRRGLATEVWGIELASDTFAKMLSSGAIDPGHAILSDFLAVKPFPVDAVVGNPPYVRLRHLPPTEGARALQVAYNVLNDSMDPSGSIWMPFVLHASRFLVREGRLALVLPYDLTYVRYARSLWRFLGDNFESLRVLRVYERMFPDILQEVVLLEADGFGGSTTNITFEAFRSLTQLALGCSDVGARLGVKEVVQGDRVFLEALLPGETQQLIRERLRPKTVPARDLVRFNIGYVCGDKRYFHPSPDIVRQFRIPERHLRVSITSSRQLRGAGLKTSAVAPEFLDQLFLPLNEPATLTSGELDYLQLGILKGVSRRYKCQVRNPWYVTPGVKVPDVLVPVFTERPMMLINDAQIAASNSLLCGYLRKGTAAALVTAWFTSLTLLQLELEVHALGGGVMVLVPREAGNMRLPIVRTPQASHLDQLHHFLVNGTPDNAFRIGDEAVLRDQLGLTPYEVKLVQEATFELGSWRTAARAGGVKAGAVT